MSSILAAHIIITLISVAGSVLAVVIGVILERRLTKQDGKLQEIHVLVNSRLDEALSTIRVLQAVVLQQAGTEPLTPEATAIVDALQAAPPDTA